ncbi:MAG TPA: CPBP family glutamic-type intramembrane protease [Kofleriaceae bacterium]|nr:CPBP family glutamic-type intramembrane protease [Kofleriaceae bacterium]
MPRELRALVPVEVTVVLAIAIFWPQLAISATLPFALPLLLAASIARWLRGRSWSEVTHRGGAAIGAAVGAVALALAIFVATPLVETLGDRAVEWSQHGFVRGSATQVLVFAVYAAIAALAAELALRGWIVERVLELSPGPPVLPILAGAIAEAVLTPGSVGVRAGAAVFGIGLGWIYVAGGRSVVAPICARVVFAVGAMLLDGLRVIG